MPELPEVETIRGSLNPLIGQRVKQVFFSKLAPVETTTPAKIRQALTGTTITAIRRWGKYLLIDVSGPATLVIHLGMSGRLNWIPAGGSGRAPGRAHSSEHGWAEPETGPAGTRHTHLQLKLGNQSSLHLTDPRRFGTISLSLRPDGSDNPFLTRLGPDYLDPTLSAEIFITRCRRHPGLALKSALLHQGIAAGLGNIYVCEALYRARLDPRRRIRRVKNDELVRLLESVRDCLALAIQKRGTTLRDYRDSIGRQGQMKKFLQIYGQPHAKRIGQGGRSTWFNPEVQK